MYSWDSNFIVGNLLPFKKRGIKMVDWLLSLIKPIETKHDEIFNNDYDGIKDRAYWNSQTMVLEYIINNEVGGTFSNTGTSSVYIEHNVETDIVYLYNDNENGGSNYVVFYKENESGVTPILYNYLEFLFIPNFVVFIPQFLSNSVEVINRLVRRLKLAGTIYITKFY
jgi:hypothetical protein